MVRLSATNLLIKSVPRKRIGQKKLKKIFWLVFGSICGPAMAVQRSMTREKARSYAPAILHAARAPGHHITGNRVDVVTGVFVEKCIEIVRI